MSSKQRRKRGAIRRNGFAYILAATCCSLIVSGCGSSSEQAVDQRARDIQAAREAVEGIESDPSIPKKTRQAMIERIEMEVREQTGEAVNLRSSATE